MMAMLRILSMERFFQIVGQPLRLPWDSAGDAPALQLRSAEYGREQRLRQTEDRRPLVKSILRSCRRCRQLGCNLFEQTIEQSRPRRPSPSALTCLRLQRGSVQEALL